jgi:hypothetical protein
MRGTYIGSNGNKIGISQQRWQWGQCRYDDSISEAGTRGGWRGTSTGKASVMQRLCHNRSDEGEGKWLSEGAHRLSMQATTAEQR